MKKRMLSMILAAMLAGTALTGCGSSGQDTGSEAQSGGESTEGSSGDSITVEFFQQKSEEGPQKGYQLVIDEFEKEYPNIKIEMNTVPDAGKVLTSRISANDIPPIFSDYPTQMQFKQKVENGYLEELTDEEFMTRINESALEMSKANDGKQYAMPLSNNFMGVYYNKDIFEENGIEIPTTYDEFINVCKTLQDNGVAPLVLTYKDPGRVGHMFQCMIVAWTDTGIEVIEQASHGEAKVAEDAQFTTLAERMLEVTSYANQDAGGIADTGMWEQFANEKYAMCITGSYARGTIMIANPDINMGVFPLPNTTKEETKILTGVDAAVCISSSASQEEKEAGLKFLEFLSRTENAQIFCDTDGAPSCVSQVVYKDEGVQPVIDLIQSGAVHDWMASTIDNNVVTDLYNVTQGFIMESQDVDQYLKHMDASIEINAQ